MTPLIPAQAARSAVSNGGFPRRHIDQMSAGMAWRPTQRATAASIAPLVQAGGQIVLVGDIGVGKTQLASWFGQTWWERGYHTTRGKARYWTLAGLLSAQKSWFGNKNTRDEPLELARTAGLLVLDEVDSTSDSMFDQRELRDLMDFRYRAGDKPTLLITNIDRSEIGTILDTPTIDRLRDGGGIIELKGTSMRGKTG